MAKRDLPKLYFDEHVKPDVIMAFKEGGFKCLLISKTSKYAGRDEKDYIQEIYAEEKVFVTGDIEFIRYVVANKIKHAGILGVPSTWDNEIAGKASAALAGLVKTRVRQLGKNSLKKVVLYVDDDGYHVIAKGIQRLVYSMDKLL